MDMSACACRKTEGEGFRWKPKGFQQSMFKGKVRKGIPGCVISSCTVLWLVDVGVAGKLTLSVLRHQKIWRLLHVHNHQAVNFVRAGRKLDMSRERRAWKCPETIHLVNNKGPPADIKKAEISELTRNHTFWGWQVSWRQTKKMRKWKESLVSACNFCSLCSHYNKISLADKNYWSHINAMIIPIRTN